MQWHRRSDSIGFEKAREMTTERELLLRLVEDVRQIKEWMAGAGSPRLMTRKEAAAALRISPATLKRRIQSGQISATADGKIPRSEVERAASPKNEKRRRSGGGKKVDWRSEVSKMREDAKAARHT